ncbi:p92-like protein [Cladobotryum mycophilum]|uniref:P92-like protein n=1 Tax=Cladobotryum mycophilum TaxID=491253 RepID=A0ABR0SCK2_9HYPO
MSDEVSQFLEQVERLRGQQIEDDEMRAREREEFLAAKRERQARREERARSISPLKSSPANTPSPRSNRRTVHLSQGLKLDSPSNDTLDRLRERSAEAEKAAILDARSDAMAYLTAAAKENEAPLDLDSKRSEFSTTTSRGSPLSWQRRNSRANTRPLSVVATQNATQRSLAEPVDLQSSSSQEPSISKEQIAQSLASKDPSWFRQTADRGATSAAYRKNQVEDEDRLDMSSVRAQLPGMTAETPKERPASRSGPNTPAQGKLTSPLPLNPPQFDAPAEKLQIEPLAPQLTGRTSPMRTTSPTKGMGGFVQSAMMKRSDSVKRWSVASTAGLTRGDSLATNRGAVVATASRPQSVVGHNAPTTSRPASRHAERDTSFNAAPIEHTSPKTPTKASPPQPQRVIEEDSSVPISPSKTMEPRRWSPTKSSWLESALNRPESPPKPPQPKAPPQQPAWMAELNKPKERPGHRHQVSISGLKTSSPMGTVTTLNPKGLGGIYSPPVGGNPRSSTLNLAGALSSPVTEPEPSKRKPQEYEEPKPERRGSVAPLPVTKTKPVTPPKKDFRSNLKPRAAEPQSGKSEEPEFKTVFGTLRRAKTQNFRAPDELKENILRGKASLNLTDGPQRSVLRDDFKDAILKKKASFAAAKVEGKGVVASTPSALDRSVPEGLAKRAELGRQTTGPRKTVSPDSSTRSPPGAAKRDSPKPIPGPKRISSQANMAARQSAPSLTPTKSPPAERPRREPAESSTPSKPETSPRNHSLKTKKSAPSRLGDRFNPALAGLLARGPPMGGNGGRGDDSKAVESATEPSAPGPQLTHMTKNRARGPKRRAPTTPSASAVSLPDYETPKPSETSERSKPERPVKSAHASFIASTDASGSFRFPAGLEPEQPSSVSIQQQVAAKAAVRSKPEPIDTRGVETERSARAFHRRQPTAPEKIVSDFSSPTKMAEPESPRKLDVKRMSKFLAETPTGDSKADAFREPARLTHTRTGSWSPTKTERSFPEPSPSVPARHMRKDSVKNAAAIFGGALVKAPVPGPRTSTFVLPREVESPLPSPKPSPPTIASPKAASPKALSPKAPSPPRVASRPLPTLPFEEEPRSPAVASPSRSPSKQGGDVSALLNDFFEPPRQRKSFKVDTAELLTNRPKLGGKIKTISFQMFQITADGKQTPVPQHNERVLFEQEMYISSHNFTNEAGWKVREVYFWIGDEVQEDYAKEAELFAQREAKTVSGKFISMRQGKETPEFLLALGGVVIVRRGSSIKYDSLAPSMLCGRRYLGQVAFDEVEFETNSLCSGFAFLIVHSGNCYLWKGKGSDVEELSCARLTGMDLSLTGELIEYDEGSEPASFWEMLSGGSKPHSADHWRLKPSYDKYCSRLFCSDEDSRQQVYEISPFNQVDVSPYNIYILDAFFEMYILVGAQAQSQYSSFRNALEFAQEYAIFAASMEDRPFVPISTVVLEGAPRDLKRVFRKWTDERCPTLLNTGSEEAGLRRGRSLRVVPLTQALLALKE